MTNTSLPPFVRLKSTTVILLASTYSISPVQAVNDESLEQFGVESVLKYVAIQIADMYKNMNPLWWIEIYRQVR